VKGEQPTGVDAGELIGAALSDTDYCTGTEASNSPGPVPVSSSDSFTGADGKFVTNTPSSTDSGSFADAASFGVMDTDSGSFTDYGTAAVANQVAQYVGAKYTNMTIGYPAVDDPGTPATDPAAYYWATEYIGQLQCSKFFNSGALPSSFPDNARGSTLPAGVLPVICYKTPTTNVADFCATVNVPIILVYYQEPETNFATGADFVEQLQGESDIIRGVGNPYIRIAMDSGSYPYRTGGDSESLAGNYLRGLGDISPNSGESYVDFFFFDSYYTGLTNGYTYTLSTAPNFANWLALVTDDSIVGTQKPLGIPEYGLGSANGNTWRYNSIQDDHDYIGGVGAYAGGGLPAATPFPIFCWMYWWNDAQMTSSTDTAHNFQFPDTATQNLWASFINPANDSPVDVDFLTGTDAGETVTVHDTDAGSAAETVLLHASSTDSCSGADAQTSVRVPAADASSTTADAGEAIHATLSSSDSASAVDASSVSASFTSTDAGTGTDAGTVTGLAFNSSDSATGAEGSTIHATLTDTDAGSAADAGSLSTSSVSSSDTATGSESQTIRLPGTDASSQTADAGESVHATFSSPDSASAADAGESVHASFTSPDTSSASDTATTVHFATTDNGSGNDVTVSAHFTASDASSLTAEASTLHATLSSPDSSTGAEASPSVLATLSSSDTASGSDASFVMAMTASYDTASFTDGGELVNGGQQKGITDVDAGSGAETQTYVQLFATYLVVTGVTGPPDVQGAVLTLVLDVALLDENGDAV
jgi:hypothetical protein